MMIAVPYLNYIRTQLGDFTTSWEELNDVAKIYKLAVLYSQEFKPEMIVEMFEGWNEGVVAQKKYILSEEVEIAFPSHNTKYKIWNGDEEGILFLPSTLDQFITDCMRAGIELQWKESIVNQYFK